MTATLLDGEALAAKIRAEVTDRVARLRSAGVQVGLGTILVGDDGPSVAVRGHEARGLCRGGYRLRSTSTCRLPPPRPSWSRWWPVSTRTRRSMRISCSCRCPRGLDEERVLLAVDPEKDVDGLHPVNLGRW